jgi:hypothetical protein
MDTPDISGVSEGIKESIKANIEEKLQEEELLPTCNIGISISDSQDLDILGFTNLHIQDAMVEMARYLLVNNCKLIYGGDLRKGGFTYIFSELAKLYSNPKNYDSFRVANYFAWPVHVNLSRLDDSEFKASNIQVVKLPPPPEITVDDKIFIKPDSIDNRVIWSKSLSYMRTEIVKNTQARIIIGGPATNFMGLMPGLLEEFLVSIRSNQPVFLCGAFGGITKSIIDTLFDCSNNCISDEFQTQNTAYKEFFNHWNTTEANKISYTPIAQEIHNFGVEGLSRLNGLSIEDNQRLFQTPHIPEMIFLVLKGLKGLRLLN